MKFILGILFSILLTALKVHSGPPLQTRLESAHPEHSHSSDGNNVLEISTKARLPANVLPSHYKLKIRPILEAGPGETQYTAPGEIDITVSCTVATDVITLHAATDTDELVIDYDSITVVNADTPTDSFAVTHSTDVPNQFLILKLDRALELDKTYIIHISFVAPIARPPILNGLYRSSYLDPDSGETSLIATTQFEAIAARQVFPCFDEPWMKAHFKVTIGHLKSEGYVALANGAEIVGEEEEIDGYVFQGFEETVKMSTYLVAIVVAKYKFTSAADGLFNKEVRTYGPPHLIEKNGGVYSANTAAKILDFLEKEYEIDYKLSKLDSISIPDFTFGAMENWGLNIYREPYLLHYDGETTEVDKNRIAIILAHELAHQWFGNLVSCQFWDQIYLNEGFATYNEFIATDAVAPEFESLKIQVQDGLQRALAFDATSATHPVINSASGDHDNDKLMTFFDRITYQKGGSIIRMMEGFLTNATLKAGLTAYLNKMEYKGANQYDLFDSLTAQAHADGTLDPDVSVKDIMDTWTLQSGFPIVQVSKAADNRIYISQSRFSNNFDSDELDPNDLWQIPVSIASAASPDFSVHTPKLWINKNVALRSYEIDTTKWVVVNPDATGYFRVLYEQPLLDLLREQFPADKNVVSTMSRSQIIDDYFAFANAKYTAIESAFEFTKGLDKEPELVVWITVFTNLRPIFNKLTGTAAFDEFRQYFTPKLAGALTFVGLEQLPQHHGANVLLRTQLLDWACAFNYAGCLDYANTLFAEWDLVEGGDHTKVPIDIPQIIYCAAVSNGGAEKFNKIKARYLLDTTSAKQRQHYLNALGCAEEPTLLASLQEQILATPSELKTPADKLTTLQKLAANTNSRAELLTFLRDHAPELITTVSANGISSVVQTLSTFVGTKMERDSINTFITDNTAELQSVMPQLLSSLSIIDSNIVWRNTYEARLLTWFKEAK